LAADRILWFADHWAMWHEFALGNCYAITKKPSDRAKLPFEVYGRVWTRFVGKTVEEPSESI
jgi:hypothetical protein